MLVTGENGVGKTNLLEAVHVGSQGFSPRTRADGQLVRFAAVRARAALAGEEGGSPAETAVTLGRGEPKRVLFNGAALQSVDELRARLSVLAFVPDRLAVVKGGPVVRRAYLDRMLGRVSRIHAALPGEYGRALVQRNEALRRARAGVSSRDAVSPWTRQVAALGNELDAARLDLVASLAPRFTAQAADLGLENAELRYEAELMSAADLEARLERDLVRGTTSLGPHLRDLAIAAGARDLRGFGSQGEQRSAVLALVLAEAELASEHRGAVPLLLLDDVLSELDRSRRTALLGSLPRGGQTVVTATSTDALPRDAAAPDLVLEVTPGKVRRA